MVERHARDEGRAEGANLVLDLIILGDDGRVGAADRLELGLLLGPALLERVEALLFEILRLRAIPESGSVRRAEGQQRGRRGGARTDRRAWNASRASSSSSSS